MRSGVSIPNGGMTPLDSIPRLETGAFRHFVIECVRANGRLVALFGCPDGESVRLFAVMARRDTGLLAIASSDGLDSYPALTPECPAAHLFEREIREQWRVEPIGHPWLKPVRFQRPLREDGRARPEHSGNTACGVADFYRIAGEEVHEVAVGPVHAGIIEPGHFRFQCHGETVHHLEISLGYQHRGVERDLARGPDRRTLRHIETVAGDTTVGHAMAYCRAAESLTRCRVPARAQVIRGIALELERMANHIGDLGALAGDIGFLSTMSFCGRIRGDVLNITAELCGNRFGRGLTLPGGAGFDLDDAVLSAMRKRLIAAMRDATGAIELLWENPSVLSRFDGIGHLSRETAVSIGVVGVAARACGIEQDIRTDFPYGIYRLAQIPIVTWDTGDVFARAFVRWHEIQRSATFILEQMDALPVGAMKVECGKPAANSLVVALVEGWRGEICHVAITDDEGKFSRYKVVDPSFHNWFGLACAMRGQQISDFPLCNKSFNLSYCGHDL